MKPLSAEEQNLIKQLADLLPMFEEIAQETWPELFENKGLVISINNDAGMHLAQTCNK